jgi:hypothetical protein
LARIGIGAGAGALSGVVGSSINGTSRGRGALLGAAVGVATSGVGQVAGQDSLLLGPTTAAGAFASGGESLRVKAARAGRLATPVEPVTLLPGISPAGPRFVHQGADGSRYWSYSSQPMPVSGPSPLRRAARNLTVYYNDPGRILRTTGRGLSEFGHPGIGRPMSITGLVIEPGGPGELVGIAAGGTLGARIGAPLGPWGALGGGVVGGAIGGGLGGGFDDPGAGYLNWSECVDCE